MFPLQCGWGPYPSWRLEGGACVMTEVGDGMVGCSAS